MHALAIWLHAEDTRHEVPRRDAFGPMSYRRPPPHPLSIPDIQALLSAALAMRPAGTITPLTWHHMFGLIAATGIRISEALALVPDDLTADGLVIRETKFRKSRMVALHPTTQDALDRYLVARRKERTPHGHLFVLATGRSPSRRTATKTFRKLAEHTELRARAVPRGPTPHSLRHAFAVRSLESLDPDADPDRHMLALATYLGHSEVAHTYWYLEATPLLLRGIPEFVGKVSCLATHRRFPPSPLHKAGCCIWATVRGSSHPGQVMAVLESLGWGVFALLLLALLGRSGLSSVLTVWSRPLSTANRASPRLRRWSSVLGRTQESVAEVRRGTPVRCRETSYSRSSTMPDQESLNQRPEALATEARKMPAVNHANGKREQPLHAPHVVVDRGVPCVRDERTVVDGVA